MRFSTILTLGLASVTLAMPTIAGLEDLPTVNNAMAAVQKAVEGLAAGVGSIKEGADIKAEVPKLTAASKAILDALAAGTTAIKGTTDLTLVESVGLLSTSQALAKKVQGAVDDFIKNKPLIDKAGETKTVLGQLNDQKKATQDFIAAIVSKVPALAKSIAQTQAGQVVTILDKGITAFT